MDLTRLSRATLGALMVATAVAAAALWVGEVRDLAPYDVVLPWWALAAGFALTGLFVVRSLSLFELPLVLGLLLAEPADLVVAAAAGSAVALLITRRRRPFEVARFALAAALAAVALHALAPPPAELGPAVWGATFAAALVSAVVSAVLGLCSAGLSAERIPSRRTLGAGLLMALTTTSVALAGAAMVAADPRALWLLVPPAALLLLAYRAYVSERAKHQSLEFLSGVARSMSRGRELDRELLDLLRRARAGFRVASADLVLFLDGGALRTSLPGEDVMVEVEGAAADALRAAVGGEHAVVVERDDCAYLAARGIRRALVAPVRHESRLTGAIMLGDPATPFSDEDLRLLETLAAHAGLSLQLDRLERKAESDPLTGLANRSLFLRRVEASLARADGTVTVLFLDLDDFKGINDGAGHAAGDAVLVAVAGRIEASVRPHDVAARMGGDEFAVLLEDVDDGHAGVVAERVLDLLSGPIAVDGEEMWVRSSVGIASVAAGSAEAAELLRQADVAMYRAKEAGKGQVRVWCPAMAPAVSGAADAGRDELAAALEGGELIAVFQPIVALDGGALVAAEALARWRHPRHGLLGPASFMPAAEASGLVRAIDREMLWQACSAAAAGSLPAVHVNVSAPEADAVEEVLLLTGLDPARLVLELSEAALADAQGAEIQRLRRIGVGIAFDDFGTGPCALELLREHPVDLVKVARPFVEGAGRAAHDRALLSMIMQVAAMFGTRVLAEGIEREDQRAALAALGFELGQGHLLGRPGPLAAVSAA